MTHGGLDKQQSGGLYKVRSRKYLFAAFISLVILLFVRPLASKWFFNQGALDLNKALKYSSPSFAKSAANHFLEAYRLSGYVVSLQRLVLAFLSREIMMQLQTLG
jgi:hypothetical protein